jgi:hypothetical protein
MVVGDLGVNMTSVVTACSRLASIVGRDLAGTTGVVNSCSSVCARNNAD